MSSSCPLSMPQLEDEAQKILGLIRVWEGYRS